MKTKLHIIIGLFFFSTVSMKGQIILEHSLDSVTTGGQFYCTDIGNNEYKYVFLDTARNGFSLYNMDMTLDQFVHIPIVGDSIVNGFSAIYISRTLFDCDSTNIEYAFQHSQNGHKAFRVIRTDGTILLEVDSANGPYSFGGTYGGAIDIRPIINTSSGTKLFLQKWNQQYGTGIRIYALCGTLPVSNYDFGLQNKAFLKIFPNPTSMELSFEITPPNNQEEFELVIMDANNKMQRRESLPVYQTKYIMDVSSMSSGIYLYSLVSKTKTYQSGKFILTK